MKYLVAIVVLVLPIYMMGEDVKANFLLLRHNQRMMLVGAGQQSSYELVSTEPLFTWEGQHSKATFADDGEGVRIEFKLDIIGPDWLFVSLTESDEGLLLCVRHTTTGGTDIDVDANWYSNYSALMDDAQYSSSISALLKRYGQNPSLPELSSLRTTCFGLPPAPNAEMESQCIRLLNQLNDDHWLVRDAAIEQLSEAQMAPYAMALSATMPLTPEQRSALNGLVDRYSIELDQSTLNTLESMLLSPEEVTLMED